MPPWTRFVALARGGIPDLFHGAAISRLSSGANSVVSRPQAHGKKYEVESWSCEYLLVCSLGRLLVAINTNTREAEGGFARSAYPGQPCASSCLLARLTACCDWLRLEEVGSVSVPGLCGRGASTRPPALVPSFPPPLLCGLSRRLFPSFPPPLRCGLPCLSIQHLMLRAPKHSRHCSENIGADPRLPRRHSAEVA